MRRSGAMPLVLMLVIALGSLTYTLTVGARSPQLGLDLQGGTSVVLGVKAGQTATSGQLDQSISIIRRRVDGLGVAEPEITRQGNFIVVSLPGVKDSQRAHRSRRAHGEAAMQRPFCTQLPTNLPDVSYTQALDPPSAGCACIPRHRTGLVHDLHDRSGHHGAEQRCGLDDRAGIRLEPRCRACGTSGRAAVRFGRDDDGTGRDDDGIGRD